MCPRRDPAKHHLICRMNLEIMGQDIPGLTIHISMRSCREDHRLPLHPEAREGMVQPLGFQITVTGVLSSTSRTRELLQHQVTADMAVATLIEEAAGVYNLVAHDTVLVLFGVNPRKLTRGNVLSNPPTVGPGATVLVMVISGFSPRGTPPVGGRGDALYQNGQTQMMAFSTNGGGSKLLGNFKLPKFDGTARHWKNWDKTLVRFLSIHQLDQVLSETFMDSLPLSPQDFAANKMVYYILEDAITPGSLAAKYLRTAAKWNGNQAYKAP